MFKLKKQIAILLTYAMVFTSFTVPTMAEENVTFEGLSDTDSSTTADNGTDYGTNDSTTNDSVTTNNSTVAGSNTTTGNTTTGGTTTGGTTTGGTTTGTTSSLNGDTNDETGGTISLIGGIKAIEAGANMTLFADDIEDVATNVIAGPANTWRKLTDYFALYCNKGTKYVNSPKTVKIGDDNYSLTHCILTGGSFGSDINKIIDVEGNPIGNYTGDLGRKAIWFTTEGAGNVTVYWTTGAANTANGDNIALYEIDNNTAKLIKIDYRDQDNIVKWDSVTDTIIKIVVASTFDIPEAGTYFIGSDDCYLDPWDTSTKAAGPKNIYAMTVKLNEKYVRPIENSTTTVDNSTAADDNTTTPPPPAPPATDNTTVNNSTTTSLNGNSNDTAATDNNSTAANNTTDISNLTGPLVTNQTIKIFDKATAKEIDAAIEVVLYKPIYDGSKKIPDFEIVINNQTLAEGTDYKVTCKNNKNADTEYNEEKDIFEYSNSISKKKRATYIISFKGQYKKLSKVSGNYMIYPAPMTVAQIIPKRDVIIKKPGRKFKAIKSIVNGLTNKKLSLTKDIDTLNIQLIPCNEKGVPTGDKAINLNESAMADSGNYLIRVYGKGNYYSYTTDGMFRLDVK